MLGFIKGVVEEVEEDAVIVEQGGIGFRIFVPGSAMNSRLDVGSRVKLYTYMNVREDAIQLYGFLTREDLRIFKLLITVSGIGPKAAMGVLSALTTDELMFAVLSDDVKFIMKAPGIGKKTAQKLILELKDKFALEDAFERKLARVSEEINPAGIEEAEAKESKTDEKAFQEAKQDAVEALVALGYSSTEALRAVKKAEVDSSADSEAILKAALKSLF